MASALMCIKTMVWPAPNSSASCGGLNLKKIKGPGVKPRVNSYSQEPTLPAVGVRCDNAMLKNLLVENFAGTGHKKNSAAITSMEVTCPCYNRSNLACFINQILIKSHF